VHQLLIRTYVFSRNQANSGVVWYNNSHTSLLTSRTPITEDVFVEQHPNQNWNTQQKPSKKAARRRQLHAGFFLGLLLDPDDGDMFPQNAG
jgi:hypothetical protein